MKDNRAFVSFAKWLRIIGICLAVYGSATLAQTYPSELDSDELMRRIVALGADGEFQRGNAEKRSTFESYMQELMTRAKARQPSALFNFGWYRFQVCASMKKQSVDVSSAPMCIQALEDLKAVAENPKISILFIAPASMSILGEMHRDGIGTRQSRYLAADWFVQSAKQRNVNGDREGAIRAMEDALNAVPDHPAAVEFRARLLK